MSTMFSIGQMNQLGDALELAGFTPDEVTKMRNFPQLKDLRRLINGQAQITIVKHIIDMDATPYIPNNWKVESHKKGGQLEWDPQKVQLYLAAGQQGGECIGGNELRLVLETQWVYNANLLDYLLAHPELIPGEWKGKYVFFWGTIYRLFDGNLYVRYLYFNGKSWSWGYVWLGYGFGSNFPAAVAGK